MRPCPTHGDQGNLDQLTNICTVCQWKPPPKRKRKKKVAVPESKQSKMRRFVLRRTTDASGISGEGIVAEGVRFSNGQAVLHWISQLSSIGVYHSADVLVDTHGHGGDTVLERIDENPMAPAQEPQP